LRCNTSTVWNTSSTTRIEALLSADVIGAFSVRPLTHVQWKLDVEPGTVPWCPASVGIGETRRLGYGIGLYQTEDGAMSRERRNYSGVEKVAILREHLIEKVPISEVCEKHGVPVTLFYAWQKKLFEEGASIFEGGGKGRLKRQEEAQARKIEVLEAKVREKNEVLAELMGEHMALKKVLGRSEGWVGGP